VTLAFVVFAAVLLISVGLLAYTSGRESLERATFSQLQYTASEKEAALGMWIAEGQTQIASIVESPFLRNRVEVLRSESDAEAAQNAHDQIVGELLPLIGEGHPEEGKFKEDRPYFMNGKIGPYVQNMYFSIECQCPAMTTSAPLLSEDGELLAVVAGRLNLGEMSDIIGRSVGLARYPY
jgi:hypothetical protein